MRGCFAMNLSSDGMPPRDNGGIILRMVHTAEFRASWLACLLMAILCCCESNAAETTQGLKPGWSESQLATFKAGCTNGIITPARRDYDARKLVAHIL